MRLSEDTFRSSVERLTGRHPELAAVVYRHGVPPFWHRPPGFATLVLFIVEQQVSLASAKAVFDRMTALTGVVAPAPLLALDPSRLQACGLTRQKLRYVLGLAELVDGGDFVLTDLERSSDEEARARLVSVTGIGPWTADVYLLSCLRRPDVWPVGDRALQVGVGEVLGLHRPPTAPELVELGERWRPLRSVAARLVWHDYLQRRGREETAVAGLDGVPGIGSERG